MRRRGGSVEGAALHLRAAEGSGNYEHDCNGDARRDFQGNLPDRRSGVEIVIAGMEDAQLRYQRPQARLMQPERFMVRRMRKMKKPKRAMATEENTTVV